MDGRESCGLIVLRSFSYFSWPRGCIIRVNGRAWACQRDLTETQYWNEENSYTDRGYRLVDFERYRYGSGWRYAAVWRQNGDRLNWPLRNQVDTAVAKQVTDFKVPGMSVAVIQNGAFMYRRGFGYQDIGAGLEYSAMTKPSGLGEQGGGGRADALPGGVRPAQH